MFRYAVDSLLAFLMSIVAGQVDLEFTPSYNRGGQIALYVGLLIGALFWGITADMIGRKWAFNLTLLITSIFAIVAGAAPNYNAWATFVAISAFGGGGNLVLDTTVFLEYLPSNKQWLVTFMAVWWGLGQTIAGLFAWAFIRKLCQTRFKTSVLTAFQQTSAVIPLRLVLEQTTWDGDTFTSLPGHWS